MSPASLTKSTIKIFSVHFVLTTFLFAMIYFVLAVLLINYHLVLATISGNYPFTYKFNLLSLLITGFFPAFGLISSVFLICNSILFGINSTLIFKTLRNLEGMGKIHLSVGGAGLIGLVTAGCGACGFTIFSLVGISASLSFLPFHGLEIHAISFLLLLFSAIYMFKKLFAAKICQLY